MTFDHELNRLINQQIFAGTPELVLARALTRVTLELLAAATVAPARSTPNQPAAPARRRQRRSIRKRGGKR